MHKFNLQLCRTVSPKIQGKTHSIVSYLQISYNGTYAHEAVKEARKEYPNWVVIDWIFEL